MHADLDLIRKERRKPDPLPQTSDLVTLSEHCKEETGDLMIELQNGKKCEIWHKLSRNVLLRLTTFNRRRGGGVEKMKIEEYTHPTNVKSSVSEEVMDQLSPEEEKLLTDTRLIEVEHKCNNFVPIFVMPDLQEATGLLLKLRDIADIDPENPYVFPARRGSLMPIRGSEIVRQYREVVPLKKPQAVTATGLRKHAATMTQVLHLSEKDQDNFAKHMGHDIRVHRKYYRLNEKATGVISVGKMTTKSGRINCSKRSWLCCRIECSYS